jgi:hypothetical protein
MSHIYTSLELIDHAIHNLITAKQSTDPHKLKLQLLKSKNCITKAERFLKAVL